MLYPVPSFEGLEPRLLLTTLVGGDIFEYQDANSGIVRVALEGDIIVELIAGDIDDTNGVLLGDMPGEITTSLLGRAGTKILGGIGGADGIEVIGTITGTGVPLEDLAINGIATSDAYGNADTYGFIVAEVNDVPILRLVKLDVPVNLSGNVAASTTANLGQVTLKDDIMSNLVDGAGAPAPLGQVNAFAVDPTTGLAYAVDDTTNQLHEINRVSGEILDTNAIAAGAITDVQAMAFDSAGNLYVIGASGGNQHLAQIDVDGVLAGGVDADIYYKYPDPAGGAPPPPRSITTTARNHLRAWRFSPPRTRSMPPSRVAHRLIL